MRSKPVKKTLRHIKNKHIKKKHIETLQKNTKKGVSCKYACLRFLIKIYIKTIHKTLLLIYMQDNSTCITKKAIVIQERYGTNTLHTTIFN